MKIRVQPNQMEQIEGLCNEYPYAYHHVDMQETSVPWHWHEALEFNYVVSGSVKVSTAGKSWTFSKGEGFFINSNVLASMANVEHCILDSHLFHPVFLGGHFNSIFETKYLHPVIQSRDIELVPFRPDIPQQRKVLTLLRELAKLQERSDTELQTRNLLSEIWLELLQTLKEYRQEKMPSVPGKERLLTMIGYIHEHYPDRIMLEDIATSASVSVRECLRCFRNGIGQSPTEYLIGYRIDCAKKQLQNHGTPITQVAMDCGFCSAAYFSKTFRRHTGISPQEYRRRLVKKV